MYMNQWEYTSIFSVENSVTVKHSYPLVICKFCLSPSQGNGFKKEFQRVRVTLMAPLLAFAWGPQMTNSAPDGKRWWWWRWQALTLSGALLAPQDQAGNMLLSPMPLLLLLLLILLLLLQTTLLLCKFLLLFHGLELLLELRNMQSSSQHT